MNKVKKLIQTLFSFESAIVLFLFAGQYKADPRFAWFPIDITLFWFVFTLALGAKIILTREEKIGRANLIILLILLSIIAYASTSLLWSPSQSYGFQKLAFLSTLSLWSMAASSLIISSNLIRVEKLFKVIFIFSLWFSLETTIYLIHAKSSSGFVEILGGNYLGVGRVVGIGSLISLFGMTFSKKIVLKIFLFLVSIFTLFLLLAIGGRGPLIAVLLSSQVLVWVNVKMLKIRILHISKKIIPMLSLTILGMVGIAFMFSQGYLTTTLNRILVLFEPGMGRSASTRLQYYSAAIEQWIHQPLWGNGLGSWPVLYGSGDIRGYPHNIFLEFLSEMGLLGTAIFSLLLVYSFSCVTDFRKRHDKNFSVLVLMLLVYALVNSMISGDISDNRFLFFVIGLSPINRISLFSKKRSILYVKHE